MSSTNHSPHEDSEVHLPSDGHLGDLPNSAGPGGEGDREIEPAIADFFGFVWMLEGQRVSECI